MQSPTTGRRPDLLSICSSSFRDPGLFCPSKTVVSPLVQYNTMHIRHLHDLMYPLRDGSSLGHHICSVQVAHSGNVNSMTATVLIRSGSRIPLM